MRSCSGTARHLDTGFHAAAREAGVLTRAPFRGMRAGKAPRASGATPEHAFIRSLVDLHDLYAQYVQECFGNSSLFHKALKEAFETFCNKQVPHVSCVWCGGGERYNRPPQFVADAMRSAVPCATHAVRAHRSFDPWRGSIREVERAVTQFLPCSVSRLLVHRLRSCWHHSATPC